MRLCEDELALSAGDDAGGPSFVGWQRAILEGDARSVETGEPVPFSPPTKLEIKLSSSFLFSVRFGNGDVYPKKSAKPRRR